MTTEGKTKKKLEMLRELRERAFMKIISLASEVV